MEPGEFTDKQFNMVKEWLKREDIIEVFKWTSNGSRYYGFSFYDIDKWGGKFGKPKDLETLKFKYTKVLDLKTGQLLEGREDALTNKYGRKLNG